MLKKIFLIAAVALAVMLVAACSSEKTKPLTTLSSYGEISNQASTEEAKVEMNTEQPSYSASIDKVTLKIKNDGPTTLTFGTPFTLEKREQGKWYVVPMRSDIAFTSIGLLVEPGERREDQISMSDLDYTLTKGEYRVIKSFSANEKEIIVAARFEIE